MSSPDDERTRNGDGTGWTVPPWQDDASDVIDLRENGTDPVRPADATSWQVQWPLPGAPYAEAGNGSNGADGGSAQSGYDTGPQLPAENTGGGSATRPSLLDLGLPNEPMFDETSAGEDYPWGARGPSFEPSAGYESTAGTAPPADVPPITRREPAVEMTDYESLMRPETSTYDASTGSYSDTSSSIGSYPDTLGGDYATGGGSSLATPSYDSYSGTSTGYYDAPATSERETSGYAGTPAPTYQPAPTDRPRITADDLTIAREVERTEERPSGWRRIFGRAGARQDEPTPEELEEQRLLAQVRTPLPDGHRLAVISLKGGVGKTTATAVLGATLASMRIDRVVAIDANPDRGTLADKVERTTSATVRNLISDRRSIGRYATLQRYVNRTPSRLEVLASEADPGASHAFDEADYAAALDMLERFYNIILTDCGTGLLHAATRAALSNADSVVVVSSSSLDGARSASATLDWLEAHGREDLARNAVAVVNEVREGVDDIDVDRIAEHFASRCRAVQRVPYDHHLAAGTVIDPEQLAAETRLAYTRIAASVVMGAAVGDCPPD